MKRVWLVLFFCLVSFGCFAQTEQERLFVRRIINFWQDQEYVLAKSYIEEFLEAFPNSSYTDQFYCLLGDIELHERHFEKAIHIYEKIEDEEIKESMRVKRWHALYQLKLFTQLFQETALCVSHFHESDKEAYFYYAEACLHEALTLMEYPERKSQARVLCREAMPYYQMLVETQAFNKHAKMAIAEIYRLLNQPKKAAEHYLNLANELQNQNEDLYEDLLFHAGVMLSKFDEEKSIETFAHLSRFGKKKNTEAVLQWFSLLVSADRWEDLEESEEFFLSLLPEEKCPLCFYYLGKIHYDKNNYVSALEYFKKSLEANLTAPYDKGALFLLMESSQKIKSLENFEKGYQLYNERYKEKGPEVDHINLLRALCYRDKGRLDKADEILTGLIKNNLEEPVFYLEKIKVLMQLNKFAEGHKLCLEALDFFNDSLDLYRLAINISLQQLSCEKTPFYYEQLASDIERALVKPNFFEKEEEKNKRILLAKAYLSLDRIQSACHLLKAIIEKFGPCAEVHFLFAHAYFKEGTFPEELIFHGEKAIELDPNLPEMATLHLLLFNAYIELAKENKGEDFSTYAALHLFAIIDTIPVSLQNRLWLANHYRAEAERTLDICAAKKAISILCPLIEEGKEPYLFENEMLQLASLYSLTGEEEKQFSLLKQLSTMHQAYPMRNWKCVDETKLALANVHVSLGNDKQALGLYQNIEKSPNLLTATEATLKLARLLFVALPQEKKKEGTVEMQMILHKLKDLVARKNLASEPLHLEAAIDYAEFKVAISPPDERENQLLYLFLDIKKEFTSKEDIWSKDYHASFELMPEKERIYQAYMRYLDAHIYLLQAKKQTREGNIMEGQSKEKAARALFSTLRQGKYAVSKYLIEKASEGFHSR